MKKNMGLIDRIVRITLSVVIMAMILSGQITGIAAIILFIVVAVFIVTSILSICPLYIPLGIDTRSKKQKAAASKGKTKDKPN